MQKLSSIVRIFDDSEFNYQVLEVVLQFAELFPRQAAPLIAHFHVSCMSADNTQRQMLLKYSNACIMAGW